MPELRISAIAAIGKNRELGKGNSLIWRIPADLKRLKELTTGHALIMGRKTYESIGRPLPNRLNIVVTSDPAYDAPGCTIATSLTEAIAAAKAAGHDQVFMFGGARIYQEALSFIEHLYITHIDATDKGADAFFPDFAEEFIVAKEYPKEEHEGLTYQWVDYVRKDV